MPAPRGSFGTYVTINPAQLQALLQSPSGPVARDLIRRGNRVKVKAQQLVGVYRPPDAYSAASRGRRPGTLRDSIVSRLAVGGTHGLAVLVGSEDKMAMWHHEGTVPHVIAARRKPRLVFFWPRVGKVVYLKRVSHPGTQPNRYLTLALSEAR